MGFKVFSDDLNHIVVKDSDTCRVINTISPNSYGITTKDEEFKQALKKTDYLVLDGVYFALGALVLQRKNIKANQGPDVFYHFIDRMNKESGRVFFLGSSQKTLDLIQARIKKEYKNITAEVFSPPFKSEFSEEENKEMVEKINAFKPDLVFVGMTCPKQEKWSIKHRDEINAGLMVCIGNVFDWFAGTQKAIHPFWFKIKLGWLVRIFIRPEIFKRNIANQMKFFWHVILIFLKLKKYD